MRLTCPNCEAQYEVPDEVIPETGRDVQCSNCGDTWFQHHPDHMPEEAEIIDEAESWDVAPEPASEPEVNTQPEPASEPEQDAEAPAPTRKELDPAVRDVLREEADREHAAREEDAGSLETQPDLGLDSHEDEAEKRSREAQTRMARLRGEPEVDIPERPDLDPGTRRNLLPDIDEINSSLSSDTGDTAASVDPGDVEAPIPPRKSGFRRGFNTVLLIAVIGLLLYVFAPQLARAVPALEGVLMSYVALVDQGRAWLDSKVLGLMGGLDGMSSEGS